MSKSKTKPIFVDNYDWLAKLNYIEFLRDIEIQMGNKLVKKYHVFLGKNI